MVKTGSRSIARKAEKKPGPWLKIERICELIDESREQFRIRYRPHLAPEDCRQLTGRGKPWEFYWPAVLAIVIRRAVEQVSPGSQVATDVIADCERRTALAKARLVEFDLAQKEGRSVDVERFLEWWDSEPSARIRRAIEILRARFGKDAADIMAEALQSADGDVASKFAHVAGTTSTRN